MIKHKLAGRGVALMARGALCGWELCEECDRFQDCDYWVCEKCWSPVCPELSTCDLCDGGFLDESDS